MNISVAHVYSKILETSEKSYYRWKSKDHTILVKLLEKYFSKEDLGEFLDTNKITKMESMKYYNERIEQDFADFYLNYPGKEKVFLLTFFLSIDYEQFTRDIKERDIAYALSIWTFKFYKQMRAIEYDHENNDKLDDELLNEISILHVYMDSLTHNIMDYVVLNSKCNFKLFVDYLLKKEYYESATYFIIYYTLVKIPNENMSDTIEQLKEKVSKYIIDTSKLIRNTDNKTPPKRDEYFKFIINYTDLPSDNMDKIIECLEEIIFIKGK
ncbi:MAG: hypothetical protein DRG78_06285 [Epsilonproteobacteria bacterium]|nr:MAG: hypothetical protein DRG78_06285 [Campylobacterota bacterium]